MDALTGDVGALTRSLTNAMPLRSDPLEPSCRPRRDHRLYRLKSGWVATRPAGRPAITVHAVHRIHSGHSIGATGQGEPLP